MAAETNSVYRVDPAELPGEAVIFGFTLPCELFAAGLIRFSPAKCLC